MGHSIFNTNHSTDDSLALAEREGAFARASGQSGCLNPYLGIAANADDISDAQHLEWALFCGAWWKGWDEEDARRRPDQLAQYSPGALILPWLLGVPLVERTASMAERSPARSGRDFETVRLS